METTVGEQAQTSCTGMQTTGHMYHNQHHVQALDSVQWTVDTYPASRLT